MKFISLFIFFLFSNALYACPYCMSSSSNPKDLYVVYALGTFILLCYVPMYVLWKMVIKYRKNGIPAVVDSQIK